MRTKIQYKDFESGEFISQKDRNVEETIDLIASFPWQDQRDHLAISLTNPGITIEGPDNGYLKLAPYYNGKYVLHYLDPEHHLYTRSFDHPEDTYSVIRAFFETQPFDHAGFRQEMTLLQTVTPHFVTQDFHYTLNRSRLLPCTLIMLLASFFVAVLFFAAFKQPPVLLIALPATIPLFAGIALLINHYRAVKGKVFIASRGQDSFAYGPVANPKTFSKKDILNIVTYGNRGRDKGYGFLAKVEINFVDGAWLDLSCLLISQEKLVAKFPQCPQSDESKPFPFISRDASALFE